MSRLIETMEQGKVYYIAEISANHAGKLENALEIVREAAKAGADCVKVQTYTPDTLTLKCDNEYFRIQNGLWDGYQLYDLYEQAYMPWEWHAPIQTECHKCGVDFLSTPFDKSAVDYLEGLGVTAYKIASFELVDLPLIAYTAKQGKPMIISCGMGSVEEIQEAVDTCKAQGNHQITLLKCCSDYPAKYEDMKLANIADMKKRYPECYIGLSDHSLGSLASTVGVTLGAQVVEKHVCMSRSIKNPDSEFSMEMHEFAAMIREGQEALALVGAVSYERTLSEEQSSAFRRSIFVTANVKKGEVLTGNQIRVIRPSNGVKPKYYEDILGKCATRDLTYGEPLQEGDYE